jgi:hypothetical protein
MIALSKIALKKSYVLKEKNDSLLTNLSSKSPKFYDLKKMQKLKKFYLLTKKNKDLIFIIDSL